MHDDSSTAEWLRLASMDFDTARYVFQNMYPKPHEIICYHCQQAAEKFLKVLAVAHGQGPLRTHDLVVLARSLEGRLPVPPPILRSCAMLNPYGVRVRYPQDMTLGEHDVAAALEYSDEIRVWAEAVLGGCAV